MTFPDVPRLRLEQAIVELTAHAQRVLDTHDTLCVNLRPRSARC
jgi:hypothetical protein